MVLEERLNEITKGLNDRQLEAVRKRDGKYLVLAGSGSGKTALLTRRVAYLIAQGVTPWQIVAISFTRKASQELSSRIQDLTGEAGIDVNTGTFHSLCIRILLKHQQALNMTNLTVLDEEESHKIVKELSEGYGYLKDAVKDVIHWIDYWGTRGIDPDEAVIENIPEDYISIYRDYIHFKRRVGYVDFDDILSLTAKLFDRRPDILEEYSSKYRYIMVDEIQDLSGLQFKIMRQLASHHGNYMCVGDDLQCQPAGTKVLMLDGTEQDIKDINVGDKVVSYKIGHARHFSSTTTKPRSKNTKGYEVLSKSEHITDGLVSIETASGKKSSYAKNHIKYARFLDHRDKWVTYIMSNEQGQYRVGKTTLFTDGKHTYSGIRNRLHQEKCSKAWILKVSDKKEEAWFIEQIAAVQFGIPQITFQKEKVQYKEEFVDRLFASIPNMEERAINVLSFFNRDINYPIATTTAWRGTQPRHLSRTHIFEIEACNILPDVMEVLEYDAQNPKGNFSTITDVTVTDEPTTVYGLNIEGYHNYVADGILTHNSVYAFRGGDVSNIMNIKQIDPDIETILLEQNYRSTNNIIQASNGFIAHNTKQLNKVSFTENQEGLPVMVYESEDELREAEYIVTMIQGMIQSGEYKYEDIAVLYRANYLSQNIALTFSSAGIPYDVQNGFNFYEREEVKTLVGYLRILDNPLDDIALEYVLNRPKRSIGDVTVDRLKMYAADVNIPLSVALAHADDIPKVNKPTKQRIRDFADLLDAMRAQLQNDPNIVRLLHYIVKQTGLMKSYDVQRTKDIERIDNIQELFNIAAMFELKDKEPLEEGQTSLSQFLTETALYAKPETGEELVGKVTLISSHGSKGMEYPVVFIIGLEQGIFPSYHALDDVDNLEEERRLMYVSMTRAEKVLFLSYNKKRYSFGRMQHCKSSQFIEELPKEYVKFLGK